MQAWIDDSGAKGQGGWMTLSGLTGEAEDWAEFSDRWDAELRSDPKIDYLSTHEAATLTGQFGNWPNWRRDAKVARLVTIANEYKLTVISVSVELSVFESLKARLVAPTPEPPAKSPIPKRRRTFSEEPYFFLFHNMSSAVCLEMVWQGAKEEIDLIFDEQKIMKPRIKEWYFPMFLPSLNDRERAIMPSEPMFRDDKKFMPLQMADFCAWVERADLNGDDHPFRRIGKRLKRMKRSRYCGMWNAERFERVFPYQQNTYVPSQAESEYAVRLREYLGFNGD